MKEYKISIITPTYNRANLLPNLYQSLVKNAQNDIKLEWLIMDDGSTDETKEVVENFKQENKLDIKYYEQENQGKMIAINKLVENATGDFIVDCDSDDYFTDDAFKIFLQEYEKYKEEKDIYGFCFLKYNQNAENMGNTFKKQKTTMFNLYFKEGETGEKAIIFLSNIRKQYKHELEQNEKFITEARMYHKMDEKYSMICINKPIMICEYQEEGYSKNLKEQMKQNPYGYYKYFEEILQKNEKGILFKKRIYAIKHFILFSYLTKSKHNLKKIKGLTNKLLYFLLYGFGVLKTKKQF